ncbi:hypothetical protein DFJ73DRAFT_795958, partial [Zopfochytrium polystomum]
DRIRDRHERAVARVPAGTAVHNGLAVGRRRGWRGWRGWRRRGIRDAGAGGGGRVWRRHRNGRVGESEAHVPAGVAAAVAAAVASETVSGCDGGRARRPSGGVLLEQSR